MVALTATILALSLSAPTPSITPRPDLIKRHFYTCGPSTLNWEAGWYTEGWYTASAAAYDREASRGPVDPPLSVVVGSGDCSDEGVTRSYEASLSSTFSISTTTGGISTTTEVFTITRADGEIITSISLATLSSAPTGSPSRSAGNTISSSTGTSSSASPSASQTANSSEDGVEQSPNTCAGGWDYQAWASTAATFVGVVFGGALWVTWAVMRGRLPEVYSTRTWYTSESPSNWSWAAFLLPFLHLPSLTTGPQSPASSALSPLFAALKLAGLSSLVALAIGPPLMIANVPCLGITAPPNNLGGRLGTLTDLSLLRLLNALDPSPGSPSTPSAIQLLLNSRALQSTIGPAIGSARVRLIVILVLIGLLSLGGGLWVVARTYAGMAKYREHFRAVLCDGLDMAVLPSRSAPGLEGMSEEKVRKHLRDLTRAGEDEKPELEIVGVFAVPDVADLREKVTQRDKMLHELERAEADYIASSAVRPHQRRPSALGTIPHTSSGDLSPPVPPTVRMAATRTKFHEINRNSALYGGKRFDIGQAIKLGPDGRYVPDPSPSSEESNTLETGENASSDTHQSQATANEGRAPHAMQREENPVEARLLPSPARHPEIVSPITQKSAHASTQHSTPSVIASSSHPVAAVNRLRAELQKANQEVMNLQQTAFAQAAMGGKVDGWVLVGRGVQWIPGVVLVEGRTQEDIEWKNVREAGGERAFIVKMGFVGAILALILMPFIGLSNAAAPGFAYYLSFLRPIADSDGLGAGIVGGLIPALLLFGVVCIAVGASEFFRAQMSCISATRKVELQYKAVFWFLFGVVILWSLLVSSLEFAVQGFASGVQESRTVGDGAIFSTWWTFVFLLNIALVIPALYIIQPKKLWNRGRMRKNRLTPRERFQLNAPPVFSPAYYLAAPLLCVPYAESLLFLFPLLAIPLFILLYLSFIAIRHMREYVFVDRSFSDGGLALWTIRRVGWGLGLQPLLFGLILLSRNEWAIGGVSIGVALVASLSAELSTARRLPDWNYRHLSATTRSQIAHIAEWLKGGKASTKSRQNEKRGSNRSSMSVLQRVAALLPGYSRLPDTCPLPLPTEVIDSRTQTERASHARPDLRKGEQGEEPVGGRTYFHESTTENRGLIYPTEMLLPTPVIWLPYDQGGTAKREAQDLEGEWGLPTIVDPPPRISTAESSRHRRGRSTFGTEERRVEGEVGNPLLGR